MQYEDNKRILKSLGGDTSKYHTNFEVRKAILEQLGGNASDCSTTFEADTKIVELYESGQAGGGGGVSYIEGTKFAKSAWETNPKIDYSKITDFGDFFNSCGNLREVTNLDTSNGTNFINMFCDCYSLETIDKLNLSNCVYNHYWMFDFCSQLKNLTIEGTINYTDILDLSYSPLLTEQSIKNVLNAAKKSTNCNNIKFGKTFICESDSDYADIRELIAECNNNNTQIEGLNFISLSPESEDYAFCQSGFLETGVWYQDDETVEFKMSVASCDNEFGVGRGGWCQGTVDTFFNKDRMTWNVVTGDYVDDYAYGYNYGDTITVNFNKYRFIFNGEERAGAGDGDEAASIWGNDQPLRLGRWGSPENWTGKVYYLKIFNGDTLTHHYVPIADNKFKDLITGEELSWMEGTTKFIAKQ